MSTIRTLAGSPWSLFGTTFLWLTPEFATRGISTVGALCRRPAGSPYWIAAWGAGETTPGFNVLVHALGSAVAFILLLVPRLEQWGSNHVMSG